MILLQNRSRLFHLTTMQAVFIGLFSGGDINESMPLKKTISKSENPHLISPD
jgi:hypothetical protein